MIEHDTTEFEIDTFVTSPGVSWPHNANHYLVGWGRLIAMEIKNGGGEEPIAGLLRPQRKTKSDPHMDSSGIALRRVQDVGQFAISIPPPWNMPIAESWKERREACSAQFR